MNLRDELTRFQRWGRVLGASIQPIEPDLFREPDGRGFAVYASA